MANTYFLTVFDSSGNTLMNDKVLAENDDKAKEIGLDLLKEHHYEKHSHRLVNDAGKLILFER
ncbi:YhzD family protein [Bacillus sp. NPDC077027]|uniref:YhzD family protein n=1 Tax=Bacillus sp. NPDC077027 TaxID=3390548 RepID=UPI003D05566D